MSGTSSKRNAKIIQIIAAYNFSLPKRVFLHIESVDILNVKILNTTEKELLSNLKEGVLFTPNVDHVMKLQNDEEFYKTYQQADWVVCDSKVIFFCSQLSSSPIKETISGSSFFKSFCQYHSDDPECRIFLLGSLGNVASLARERINTYIGRNIVVDALSPSMGFENNQEECEFIIDQINKSNATVLIVGVGAPKQEKYIMKWKDHMPHIKIFMALGATIDFEAGVKRRAPQWIRRIGMEWFYRFIHEPRRLFRRYFIHDLGFFLLLAKQRIGKYHNPWERGHD